MYLRQSRGIRCALVTEQSNRVGRSLPGMSNGGVAFEPSTMDDCADN